MAGLSTFLISMIGKANDSLGYLEADMAIVISQTLLDCDLASESDITDTNKRAVYLVALVNLWEKVATDTIINYDISSDGASLKRSQIHEYAEQQLEKAKQKAAPYLPPDDGPSYYKFSDIHNPYVSYPPYYERDL